MKPQKEKQTYRTINWADYNQALKQRGNLTFWIEPETRWYATPNGKPERNHKFTDTAIQTCLTIKTLFNLPLLQTQGFMQSIIQLAQLDWEAPDYSTLSRRQKHINIIIPYNKSTNGLDILIDSTGIKMTGEGEWHTKKHGKEKRRQWRKVHIGIDAETGQVRAVGVTTNSVGDSPMLGELLVQIPKEEDIKSVRADGAYDTKDCYHHIADREAQAIIPPRSNAVIWKNPEHKEDKARNKTVREYQQLGEKQSKEKTRYHMRSLVEGTMYRLKHLGRQLVARDFER